MNSETRLSCRQMFLTTKTIAKSDNNHNRGWYWSPIFNTCTLRLEFIGSIRSDNYVYKLQKKNLSSTQKYVASETLILSFEFFFLKYIKYML